MPTMRSGTSSGIFQSTLSMRRATLAVRPVSCSSTALFQSTLSMRRATDALRWPDLTSEISIHALHEESDARQAVPQLGNLISIHALHEESDRQAQRVLAAPLDFNPRSP